MLRSKTRWEFRQIDEQEVDSLAKKTKVHPLVVRLCWLRGLRTPEEIKQFLEIESFSFHDPFLMKGMKEAVERIRTAINRDEYILIYGDYDADGVSSTTILYYLLSELGARYHYYIPDRFSEGYGLNKEAIEKAAEDGVSLMITVDTGISAYQEVEYAKERGIDVIITDHHEPPEQVPLATAVINPKQKDCTYPFPYLCGAGVAIKLSQALLGTVPEEWLGIAAIGTIADLVPLKDENRLIATTGLRALTHTSHVGLRALCKEAGIENEVLTSFHVGFALGPRINAGGRLDRADLGVQLFTTTSPEEAAILARRLNQLNMERQELVKHITEEAELKATQWMDQGMDHVLVVAGEGWNEGVIGIVASKLVEKYYRPSIVLSIDVEKGMAKGSARSIDGFDLFLNLTECKDYLVKYGGHTAAAGLSITLDQIDHFRSKINQLGIQQLSDTVLQRKTMIDLTCSLQEINLQLAEQLAQLAPFGADNPEPLLHLQGLEIASMKSIGRDGEHLKWSFKQEESVLEGIGFRFGGIKEKISPQASLNIVAQLTINEWNGVRKPQLLVKDLAVEEIQIFDHRGLKNRYNFLEKMAQPEKAVILYFRPENRVPLEHWVQDRPFILMPISRKGELIGKIIDHEIWSRTNLILFDLPTTFLSLQALREWPQTEQIWCLFGSELNDQRLQRIPDREAFKWIYSFLLMHKRVAMDEKIWEIGKRKGLSAIDLQFIFTVFKELQLVQEQEGQLYLVENPQKQSFELSRSYQFETERIKVETELVFSSTIDLSKWILNSTESWNVRKEATGS